MLEAAVPSAARRAATFSAQAAGAPAPETSFSTPLTSLEAKPGLPLSPQPAKRRRSRGRLELEDDTDTQSSSAQLCRT